MPYAIPQAHFCCPLCGAKLVALNEDRGVQALTHDLVDGWRRVVFVRWNASEADLAPNFVCKNIRTEHDGTLRTRSGHAYWWMVKRTGFHPTLAFYALPVYRLPGAR